MNILASPLNVLTATSDISIPNVNEVEEEKKRLAKEIEELKNDSNFTQTNTISMGRSGGTIKVNAASGDKSSVELKKAQDLNSKLKQDCEVLNGKLKGLQAANMAMNDQLNSLKSQKEEFSKSLETVKDLQRQLDEKSKEVEKLKEQLKESSSQEIKDALAETVEAPAALDETLEVPKDSFENLKKDQFDETLQITMEAVKGSDRYCSSCGTEYPISAKFCPKCGAKNEKYSD